MEFDKKLMGNRIKKERINIGLTQEGLAQKLGLNNKSSISQYESGDAIPSDDVKFAMSKLFDCSIDYILGKTDKRNPDDSLDKDKLYIALSKEDKGYISDEVKSEILQFAQYVIDQEKKKKSDKKEQ